MVLFAGNIGLVQGLETVIRSADLLRQEAGVVFVFVGDGTDRDRLMSLARLLALPNVLFVDRQPHVYARLFCLR